MMSDIPDLPAAAIVPPAEAVWGTGLQPAGCRACGQAHLVAPEAIGAPCPNCAQAPLEEQPARLRPEPPELAVPFRMLQPDLARILTAYVQPVWLRPDDLDPVRLLQRARRVYWPMWLVDADMAGDWQLEAGFDYQVKSAQESYRSGQWVSDERVETRVRWEQRAGHLARHYDNIAVPALDAHDAMGALAGHYDRAASAPYDAAQAAGAALRVPDLPPQSAWPLAQSRLETAAAEECRAAAGAQHGRNFAVRAQFANLNWTQLLLPLWVTTYQDDDGRVRVIAVNGQSGQPHGPRLASQRKGLRQAGILAAIAAIAFVLGLVLALAGGPALAGFAPIALVPAFFLAAAALVPAVWPWQWNRHA